jgi:hypothetical protein
MLLGRPAAIATITGAVRDSNSGSITCSRHWMERFEAVTLPEVSNCVAAGSR